MGNAKRTAAPAEEEKRAVGRPSTVVGKRTQVYLDDESKKTALRLGGGNLSEGIRTALRMAGDVHSEG